MNIQLSSRPKLASFVRLQHDAVRDRWVLQAPERVLILDDTGKSILERCNGSDAVDEIVTALATEYDAPRKIIEQDVLGVLRLLAEKSFLVDGEDGEPG